MAMQVLKKPAKNHPVNLENLSLETLFKSDQFHHFAHDAKTIEYTSDEYFDQDQAAPTKLLSSKFEIEESLAKGTLLIETQSNFLDGDVTFRLKNEHGHEFRPTLTTERTKIIMLEGLHAGTYHLYIETEKLQLRKNQPSNKQLVSIFQSKGAVPF